MPDPLDVLPYELWVWCIAIAINGREAGPLELLAVSKRWERLLLDAPSLWNQIYVQNGQDELARISTFLHFSTGASLHVDIMTALPTMKSLELISAHNSRVTTISIRPAPSDTVADLQMERWREVASHTLARLSNGVLVPDTKFTSCFGISLPENNRLYYCIVSLQFTAVVASTTNITDADKCRMSAGLPVMAYSQIWKKQITRVTHISQRRDATFRTGSIEALVSLASCPPRHGAIKTAILSCIKLLTDANPSIRSSAAAAVQQFSGHPELWETVGLSIPSIAELFKHRDSGVVVTAISLVEKLAENADLRDFMRPAIAGLVVLFQHKDSNIRVLAVSLVEKLAEYDELQDVMKRLILALSKLVQHGNSIMRSVAVSLLGKLAERDEFLDAVRVSVPALIKLFACQDSHIVLDALSVLQKLAHSGECQACIIWRLLTWDEDKLRQATTRAIVPLIKLFGHRERYISSEAAYVLGDVSKYGEFREALSRVIPALVTVFERGSPGMRYATVSLFVNLAEYDELREAMKPTIPALVKLHDHGDSGVQSSMAYLLRKLSKYDELREAVSLATPFAISWPQGRDSYRTRNRRGSIMVQGMLSQLRSRNEILDLNFASLISNFDPSI